MAERARRPNNVGRCGSAASPVSTDVAIDVGYRCGDCIRDYISTLTVAAATVAPILLQSPVTL